jgi:hypothetical protein
MATKKTKELKDVQMVDAPITFDEELDLALTAISAAAPADIKPLVKDLKESILNLHNRYLCDEIKARDVRIDELHQDNNLMRSDIEALKTTVLRMAVVQYGG